MQESPWYTSEQASIILQRHPDTIRRLCQKGRLEGARKFGGEWYIPRTTIDPPTPQEKPATPRCKEQQV